MIRRRTINGIIGLGTLVVLSAWLQRDTALEHSTRTSGLDTRLDYALYDFEGRYFDETGELAGLIEAPLLTNEASTDIGRVERPRFEVVQDGRLWTILSAEATASSDRESLLFSGPVNLYRLDPAARRQTEIRARDVTLEIESRLAHSRAAVSVHDGDNVLNAEGFRLDLTDNRFQLMSEVHGRYVVR